jgi:thiamine biosynthesis lipoprotein
MGTRYAAVFFAPEHLDLADLRHDLQQAVDAVDGQMSTWKADSDLMVFNRAPVGVWHEVPGQLATVIETALEVGRLSDGAFDIGVGDLVTAWGFGPGGGAPDLGTSGTASAGQRRPAHLALELDRSAGCLRKHAPISLDLSGIAKGFGVDELSRVLSKHKIARYLVSIDGELRAGQQKPDGSAWSVALEKPDTDRRDAAGVIELVEAALATSGDYRHFIERDGVRYAHTIDPHRRAPLLNGPAAATVRAPTAMEADAWATAMMVLGPIRGSELASDLGLDVLFAERAGGAVRTVAPTSFQHLPTPSRGKRL